MTDGRSVTATGSASTAVPPDRAVITVGVQVAARTAAEAMATAVQRTTALLGALRSVGVAEDGLQTSGLGLWRDQQQRSFVASHQVVAAVAVEGVGTMLDACARATGDDFALHGVTLVVSDPAPHLDALRHLAVADARSRAATLAAAEGARVGAALRIEEGGSPSPGFGAAREAALTAMPIAAGSHALALSVTVTFELLAG